MEEKKSLLHDTAHSQSIFHMKRPLWLSSVCWPFLSPLLPPCPIILEFIGKLCSFDRAQNHQRELISSDNQWLGGAENAALVLSRKEGWENSSATHRLTESR